MSGSPQHDPAAAAQRLADELLFPQASAVERADSVPVSHLDRLAAAGLYGLAGPPAAGAMAADPATLCAAAEALAGGCLATAFVWLQHHGLVRTLAGTDAPAPLRDSWLAPLCRGERRAGIALAGLHPGPPTLRAVPDGAGGWRLEGSAAWVTGWGLVDVLQVVARGPDETAVWCLVDARSSETLAARRLRLSAVDASRTVHLDFRGLAVPADRVLKVEPYIAAAWSAGASLRVNGSLSLGVAARCCRLIGPSGLDAELADCRRRMDTAPPEAMADARAAASELALRAAAGLVVAGGSRSVLAGAAAERLSREAAFLLVFGSRDAIRAGLRHRLGLDPRDSSR